MITSPQLDVIQDGLDFDGYMAQWRAKNALPMKGLDPVARRTRFYSRYNLERQERVEELWKPSPAFQRAVDGAPGPAIWLFLTDDWCVDSAYSLPQIKWASDRRADISLRILLKDDHPAIMDLFLTNGKRSIPKFVGVSLEGDVQFVWGPQPEIIRAIRQQLMDSQAEGRIVSATTVDWYAAEGWLEVERELTEVLSGAARTDG